MTATVVVRNPSQCIALQENGWSIAVVSAKAVGWKRDNEVTSTDRKLFNIRFN